MPLNLDRLRTGGALQGPLAQRALPPEDAPRELSPGDCIGAFRIVRELSRGGMAIVYLAERADGEFSQRVALKWMSLAGDRAIAEAMFRRERDIVASLEHPGIARLIDGGRSGDGMLWFAMELVDGEPIDRWCAQHAPDMRRRVRLVVALCVALGHAHARLLIHRDIKPGNVLVDAAGNVRLLDFGIARLVDQRDLLGNFALTPGYASPEQWRGDEVTIASDVYQAGLLLAVVLGVLPPAPPGAHVTRTLASASASEQPAALDRAALARLPRELAAIIARATALAPGDRYVGIAALAEDLQAWLARRPVRARDGGIGYRLACFARRHPVGVAFAAIATVLLVALAWRVAIERHAAALEAQRAREEGARATSALNFLWDVLLWATPQRHRGREVTVAEALAQAVDQLRGDAATPPQVRAQLLFQLGKVYSRRRDRAEAGALYGESYALIASGAAVVDDSLRGEVAYALASQLADGSQRARSLALVAEAMSLLDLDKPADAENFFHAWRLKAIRLNQDNRLAEAVAENEAALAAARRRFGPDSAITARVMHDLSGRLAQADRLDEAFALKRDGYTIQRRLLGADHVDTSLAAVGYAAMLIDRGELSAAKALIDEDGAVRLRLWGEQHPEYARHLSVLAIWHEARGELEAARAISERAIAILSADEALGRTMLSLRHFHHGRVLEQHGRVADADAAYARGLEPALFSSKLGWGGGELVVAAARTARRLGRRDDAVALLTRADALLAALPADHRDRIAALLETGHQALDRDDRAAARVASQRAAALLAVRRDPDPLLRAEAASLAARLAATPG